MKNTSLPRPKESRPLVAAIVDVAGGVALFVLLFAALHLPIVT